MPILCLYLNNHLYSNADDVLVTHSELTQTKVRGASQAMLYATGMAEKDMDKPQVGVCSVWYEGSKHITWEKP